LMRYPVAVFPLKIPTSPKHQVVPVADIKPKPSLMFRNWKVSERKKIYWVRDWVKRIGCAIHQKLHWRIALVDLLSAASNNSFLTTKDTEIAEKRFFEFFEQLEYTKLWYSIASLFYVF
jgi:hypothetical protein